MTTPEQLRAARALIGLSQGELAERVGVSSMTIKRAEGAGQPVPSQETVAKIKAVLEAFGVLFIAENGGGHGVRMAKPAGDDVGKAH